MRASPDLAASGAPVTFTHEKPPENEVEVEVLAAFHYMEDGLFWQKLVWASCLENWIGKPGKR